MYKFHMVLEVTCRPLQSRIGLSSTNGEPRIAENVRMVLLTFVSLFNFHFLKSFPLFLLAVFQTGIKPNSSLGLFYIIRLLPLAPFPF